MAASRTSATWPRRWAGNCGSSGCVLERAARRSRVRRNPLRRYPPPACVAPRVRRRSGRYAGESSALCKPLAAATRSAGHGHGGTRPRGRGSAADIRTPMVGDVVPGWLVLANGERVARPVVIQPRESPRAVSSRKGLDRLTSGNGGTIRFAWLGAFDVRRPGVERRLA